MIKNYAKRLFYSLPMPERIRNKVYFAYKTRAEAREEHQNTEMQIDAAKAGEYTKAVLSIPQMRSDEYVAYENHEESQKKIKYIAYYLTQFHPNEKNDEWWGKGTTEWTNVSKTVPQYVGHYQPRLPGELGYYDLRIKENMQQQILLAKNYGIHAFCFYYYWFDGARLLEQPLNMFLENPDLDIQFCYSWANENWTKRFSGTNTDILMKIGDSAESDIRFIYDVIPAFQDNRYVRIDDKPVLIVYRPVNLHEPKKVLAEWRRIVKEQLGTELYIIATQEKADSCDWMQYGFDAETEFMPKTVLPRINEINGKMPLIRKDFHGCIYDYREIVEKQLYLNNPNRKVYPAVMPMWDNTARRNNNAVIFHGATPKLYAKWLKDIGDKVIGNTLLDDKMVFINAWNEWGEGTYLEPDRYWGYAFLEETYRSLEVYDESSVQ